MAARSAAEARLAEIQRIKAQIAIDEEAARQSLDSAIRRELEIGSMLEQDDA